MKKLLLILALLTGHAFAGAPLVPYFFTWAVVQHTCNAACASGTSCNITVTTPGVGNLGVVGMIIDNPGATSRISTVSGGGTYTNSTAGATKTQGAIDASYTTATAASGTTVTVNITPTSGAAWRACYTEISSSTGGIALDTGATPQANNTVTSNPPTGPALTVSGANLTIVTEQLWSGTLTGASGSYSTGVDAPNGNGWARAINISVGTAVAWTPTTNGSGGGLSIAFKENASGGVDLGVSKWDKYQKYDDQ